MSPDDPTVLDTSELRWFAMGAPPSDIMEWFSAGGSAGTSERRDDTYEVNGSHEVGLKRRFGQTLEAKVRQAVGPTVTLGAGLEAPLEEWRKWVPAADDSMRPGPDARWIRIEKQILTRTFMLASGEVAGPASHADELSCGCDVEIASVRIGGVETWTLAFEAFGPRDQHQEAILSSWRTLAARANVPDGLSSTFQRVAGYPEWLDLVVSQRLGNRPPKIDGAA